MPVLNEFPPEARESFAAFMLKELASLHDRLREEFPEHDWNALRVAFDGGPLPDKFIATLGVQTGWGSRVSRKQRWIAETADPVPDSEGEAGTTASA